VIAARTNEEKVVRTRKRSWGRGNDRTNEKKSYEGGKIVRTRNRSYERGKDRTNEEKIARAEEKIARAEESNTNPAVRYTDRSTVTCFIEVCKNLFSTGFLECERKYRASSDATVLMQSASSCLSHVLFQSKPRVSSVSSVRESGAHVEESTFDTVTSSRTLPCMTRDEGCSRW